MPPKRDDIIDQGAQAAIVIAVLVSVSLIAGVLYYRLRKRQRELKALKAMNNAQNTEVYAQKGIGIGDGGGGGGVGVGGEKVEEPSMLETPRAAAMLDTPSHNGRPWFDIDGHASTELPVAGHTVHELPAVVPAAYEMCGRGVARKNGATTCVGSTSMEGVGTWNSASANTAYSSDGRDLVSPCSGKAEEGVADLVSPRSPREKRAYPEYPDYSEYKV